MPEDLSQRSRRVTRRSKDLTCEFYEVYTGSVTPPSLTEIIMALHGRLVSAEERSFENDDDIYRIEKFTTCGSNGEDCQGVLVRLKKNTSPQVASRHEEGIRDLQLNENEYVASTLAFKYFHETKTLVSERSYGVGNSKKLAEYLRHKAEVFALQFVLRINNTAQSRLDRMRRVNKWELNVVKSTTLFADDEPSESVQALTALTRVFGAVKFKIIMEPGSPEDFAPMNPEEVKEATSFFVNSLGFKTSKAKVTGLEDGLEYETIVDMIADKISYSYTMEYAGSSPMFHQYITAFDEAYNNKRHLI